MGPPIHRVVGSLPPPPPPPRLTPHRSTPQASGSSPYSLDVLLAVLRLYLVFPEAAKQSVVASCLATALQRLPDSHFTLCLHLVPEALQSDAEVSQLVQLHGSLDAAAWKAAWATAASSPRTATPAFTEAMRRYVASTLASVYRSLPADVAQEALNFARGDDAAFAAWVAQQPGWVLQGGAITVPRTESNDPKPATVGEAIPFRDLVTLLSPA